MGDPAPPAPEAPPLRDALARERTALANERTLLAYGRTALALLVVGVTMWTIGDSPGWRLAGIVCDAAGIALFGWGLVRFVRVRQRL